MPKLNKSLLRKAKKAAKEAGNELPSNKKDIRQTNREIRSAVRKHKAEHQIEKPSVTWNLDVGDLVQITKSDVTLGCIVKIDTEHARNIKDWGQEVVVLTKHGKYRIHPRHAKVIQKA
jgi:hypothetical protein